LIDLQAIGAACRERDIALIVDATQAVGILPGINVRNIQPTALACSAHKWLRGPSGCSLMYISKAVQNDWIPLDFHSRGRDFEAGASTWNASRNEMGPNGYPERFYTDARKFDSGGKANSILLPMLAKSLEEVAALGDLEIVQQRLKRLMEPLFLWVRENNSYSLNRGPRAYHLIGIVPENRTPEEMIEMAARLQQRGIYIAVRCGCFRISPYLTTTNEDVEELIQGLRHIS
jgi:selenocysteine lyase/cysteine desulfurase